LLGDTKQGRASLIEHAGGLAARLGEWKYIPPRPGVARARFTDTDTGNNPEAQLYDLTADPGETKNLAANQPQKVKELAALLEEEKSRGMPAPARNRVTPRREEPKDK
jgi:arylsulfatase A-like enzyme